jgi:hypothetical protein
MNNKSHIENRASASFPKTGKKGAKNRNSMEFSFPESLGRKIPMEFSSTESPGRKIPRNSILQDKSGDGIQHGSKKTNINIYIKFLHNE